MVSQTLVIGWVVISPLGRAQRLDPKILASLLPRPNPLTTFPFSCRGKGGSGPESGPVTGSRGPLGRMMEGVGDGSVEREAEVCRGWASAICGRGGGEVG